MKFPNQLIKLTTSKSCNTKDDNVSIKYLLTTQDNKDNLNNSYTIKTPEGCIAYDSIQKTISIYLGQEEDLNYNLKVLNKSLIKLINSQNLNSLCILKDENINQTTYFTIISSLVNASYNYSLKSKTEDKEVLITIETTDSNNSFIEKTLKQAQNKNLVRDIINTPPNMFIPESMLEVIKHNFVDEDFEVVVVKDKELLKEDMNLFYSVGKASIHSSMLIHLIYRPKTNNSNRKKVALVGKGLTYDSGGLSIKPSEHMATMKSDKGGSATVLGIMKNIKDTKPDIEVHAVFGMAENMIDGSSYKPDDVIKSKNGLTVEVLNTDAEGRLVLADCLSYIQEKEPELDYMVDFATLTGAAVVALGEYTFAIMGNDKTLKEDYEKSSVTVNEYSNQLNFNNLLDKTLKSDIADIANISSTRYGGALTAGLFLNRFINKNMKDKWLHIDIAGPAFVSSEWEDKPKGASGVAVDTTTDWIYSLV